jgi:hypothetical protein
MKDLTFVPILSLFGFHESEPFVNDNRVVFFF